MTTAKGKEQREKAKKMIFGLLSGHQVEPAPGAQNDSLRLQLRQQQHPTAGNLVVSKRRPQQSGVQCSNTMLEASAYRVVHVLVKLSKALRSS